MPARPRPTSSRPSSSRTAEPVVLLVFTVAVALVFDFTNGFHDTANAVATSVSTRALSPRLAVLIAAVANLAGAFVTTAVAKTVGKGIIDTGLASEKTVLAAVAGAIVWNLITWWLGLPSSSSHALIGGLVGAALVQSGEKGVQWHGIAHNVVIPAVWAPAIAFAASFLLLLAIYWLFQWLTPGVANRSFRLGQLATGTWVAFTHGANDAQKTMGVIALALYTHGSISSFYVPTWVKIAAGAAIGLGTYAGGWRIMRTLGQRVFQMDPPAGFAAQASAGAVIYASTKYGYPLSTTHVVSGAVMGAGATRRLSAVRWGVAGNILVAWVLTIPAAALVAAAVWFPVDGIF
jgi:inorganic phosphate transporter, PiT family